MRMNPNLILAQQQFDPVNALAKGNQAGFAAGQMDLEKEKQALYRKSGGDIMAGDQNALRQLAQYSPQEAQDIKVKNNNMDNVSKRTAIMGANYARQLANDTAALDATKKKQAAEILSREIAALGVYSSAAQAGDPEALAAMNRRLVELELPGIDGSRNLSYEEILSYISPIAGVVKDLAAVQELTGGGPGDAVEYGLKPIFGTDEAGNTVMMQTAKNGTVKQTPLPEGVKLGEGIRKLDLGTHFQFVNEFTQEPIGEPFAKELEEAAAASSRGAVIGKTEGEDKALLAQMTRQMPNLINMTNDLRELAKTATYTQKDEFANWLRKEAGLPESDAALDAVEYKAMVANSILPLLRQTFGAAFTANEGESLKATLGDPSMSPEAKMRVIDAFVKTKVRQIESLNGVGMVLENNIADAGRINEAESNDAGAFGGSVAPDLSSKPVSEMTDDELVEYRKSLSGGI